MTRVAFTSNLERHVPCPPGELEADSLQDLMTRVFEANPRLGTYVLDEQGRLRQHMTIFIDGAACKDRIHLSDSVHGADEVYVFQLLSGG